MTSLSCGWGISKVQPPERRASTRPLPCLWRRYRERTEAKEAGVEGTRSPDGQHLRRGQRKRKYPQSHARVHDHEHQHRNLTDDAEPLRREDSHRHHVRQIDGGDVAREHQQHLRMPDEANIERREGSCRRREQLPSQTEWIGRERKQLWKLRDEYRVVVRGAREPSAQRVRKAPRPSEAV